MESPNEDSADASSSPPTQSVPSSDLWHCQFSSWYPIFSKCVGKKRVNVTINSKIVYPASPTQFQKYLLSDGVNLPTEATKVSSFLPDAGAAANENDSWASSVEDKADSGDGDADTDHEEQPIQQEQQQPYTFPDLTQQFQDAIDELGGSAVPKLNWSSPKDATWMNGGSLKCQTPGDIYVLLKSSDFVQHDVELLSQQQRQSEHGHGSRFPLQCVLRKFCTLYPSMEFRCFVRSNQLLAISQRNDTQFYKHLANDQDHFADLIEDFFEDYIQSVFGVVRVGNGAHSDEPEDEPADEERKSSDTNSDTNSDANAETNNHRQRNIENYVFDVYIDKKDRVWLMDFNPWSDQTDSVLFEWEELRTMDADGSNAADNAHSPNSAPMNDQGRSTIMSSASTDIPIVRVVETDQQIRQDPLASYRAPIDTVHLASLTGALSGTAGTEDPFEELIKLCQDNI